MNTRRVVAVLTLFCLGFLVNDVWFVLTDQMTQNGHVPFLFPCVIAVFIACVAWGERRDVRWSDDEYRLVYTRSKREHNK